MKHFSPGAFTLATASALFLALSGCTTMQETPPTGETAPQQRPPTKAPEGARTSIDVQALARALRMDRSIRDLGYEEKPFNPCDHGYRSGSCATQYLIVANFLIQCRDTEGTIQDAVGAADITPLHSDEVKWTLGKLEGMTSTDRDGYGQVVTIAAQPHAKQRLRITANGKYLAQTAENFKRIVAPRPMCVR